MKQISNIEKVAIIISSLDPLHQAKLLAMLNLEERNKINQNLINTTYISAQEKSRILTDFINIIQNKNN